MLDIVGGLLPGAVKNLEGLLDIHCEFVTIKSLSDAGTRLKVLNNCNNCAVQCPVSQGKVTKRSFYCFNGDNLYFIPYHWEGMQLGYIIAHGEENSLRKIHDRKDALLAFINRLVRTQLENRQVITCFDVMEKTVRLTDTSLMMLNRRLADLKNALNADAMVFALADGNKVEPLVTLGLEPELLQVTTMDTGLESWLLVNDANYVREVTENRQRLKHTIFKDPKDIGAMLSCIPVVDKGGTVCGFIYACYKQVLKQQPQLHDQVLRFFAGLLASVYMCKRLEHQVERQTEYLDALGEVIKMLNSDADIDEVVKMVVDLTAVLWQPRVVAVMIFGREQAAVKAAWCADDDAFADIQNFTSVDQIPDSYNIFYIDAFDQGECGILLFKRDLRPDCLETQYLKVLADILSAAFAQVRTQARLDKMLQGTLKVMAKLVEMGCPFTFGHSERVSRYAHHLALAAGASVVEAQDIARAASLHDVGKILVPEEIMLNTGDLSAKEKEQVQQHPLKGAELVKELYEAPYVYEIVRSHHECLDGSGYPDGLRGEQISFAVRVVAIANSYEAMTQSRPHRPKKTANEAYQELLNGAGLKYDARLVQLFGKVIADELTVKVAAATKKLGDLNKLKKLTAREREVLERLAQGCTNQEISEQLYISERTVKSHISKILQKLEVGDRTKAAIYAVKSGWF